MEWQRYSWQCCTSRRLRREFTGRLESYHWEIIVSNMADLPSSSVCAIVMRRRTAECTIPPKDPFGLHLGLSSICLKVMRGALADGIRRSLGSASVELHLGFTVHDAR
jgi:hypothetical protein